MDGIQKGLVSPLTAAHDKNYCVRACVCACVREIMCVCMCESVHVRVRVCVCVCVTGDVILEAGANPRSLVILISGLSLCLSLSTYVSVYMSYEKRPTCT